MIIINKSNNKPTTLRLSVSCLIAAGGSVQRRVGTFSDPVMQRHDKKKREREKVLHPANAPPAVHWNVAAGSTGFVQQLDFLFFPPLSFFFFYLQIKESEYYYH